jgi:hypothetical protein
VNSEERKGIVARVRAWVQSRWLHPDGSVCQVYQLLASMTLLLAACFFAMYGAGSSLITLAVGLVIASFSKHVEWQHQRLNWACGALLIAAVQECCCKSFPEGGKGSCYVCDARSVLREYFPGELPYQIRKIALAGFPLSEELESCLSPSDKFILNDELRMGWKVPYHPK